MKKWDGGEGVAHHSPKAGKEQGRPGVSSFIETHSLTELLRLNHTVPALTERQLRRKSLEEKWGRSSKCTARIWRQKITRHWASSDAIFPTAQGCGLIAVQAGLGAKVSPEDTQFKCTAGIPAPLPLSPPAA